MDLGELGPEVSTETESGEAVFRQLCALKEIPLPVREIRTIKRGFEVLGQRGKPVKTALRGFTYYRTCD